MSSNTPAEMKMNKTFVQAVSTIKSLTDLSKSHNLPRPPIADRLELFAIYNQATRGDAPPDTDISTPSEARKYNAWVKYRGFSRQQARKEYVKCLLDILKSNYPLSQYPEVVPLLQQLQISWDKIEFNETHSIQSQQYSNKPQGTPNIPVRSQSPAASLFRIASSGLNSTIMRPSSRNQSYGRSRQNSMSGQNNNNNASGQMNSNISTLNDNTILNKGSNVVSPNNDQSSPQIISSEFTKWQNDINNTLLLISSEISSLKMNSSDAGNRSISGSTTISTQSEIHDYKLRNSVGKGIGFSDRISSFYKSDRSIDDTNNSHDNETTAKWIYRKLLILFHTLKNKVVIRLPIDMGLTTITSIIGFILFSLTKTVMERYLRTRGLNNGIVYHLKEWVHSKLTGYTHVMGRS